MKFSVIISAIKSPLSQIVSLASSSGVDEKLRFVCLEVKDNFLTFYALDDANEISYSLAMIPEDIDNWQGSICVNAQRLGEVVAQFNPADKVSFEYDNNSLVLFSDNTRFEIQAKEDKIQFWEEDVQATQKICIAQKTLKTIIDQTIFCVTTDHFRDYLRGLRFECTENKFSVFSSDAHRLACAECELANSLSAPLGVTLSKKSAEELNKILNQTDEIVEIGFSDTFLVVECNNFKFKSKLLNVKFPNVRSIIPTSPTISVKLDLQALQAKVKQVSILSNARLNAVVLSFQGNELTLRSENTLHEVATSVMKLDEPVQSPFELCLNATYILDSLKALNGYNQLSFAYFSNSPNSVIEPVFKADDTINIKYVISKVII